MQETISAPTASNSAVWICSECDWVVAGSDDPKKNKVCPRCHSPFKQSETDKKAGFVYSLSALILFFMSIFLPFMEINIMGIVNHITLIGVLEMLFNKGELILTLILLCLIFIFPVMMMTIQCLLLIPRLISGRIRVLCLLIYTQLSVWAIPEIFMAGLCVSFIKLTSYGDISIFLGFWCYGLYIFAYIKSILAFPKRLLWNEIGPNQAMDSSPVSGQTAEEQQLQRCHSCGAAMSTHEKNCYRCGTQVERRVPFSIQKTLAFLLTAAILYIPANVIPVMGTLFLGDLGGSTILDGVLYMWGEGDYPVAMIIFCASILIPLLKITGLSFLCYFCRDKMGSTLRNCQKLTTLYRAIEVVGKWSMIDVFVVIVLSSLIENGQLIAVFPDNGVYFFGAVVVITIIASLRFDPRMIWDRPITTIQTTDDSASPLIKERVYANEKIHE